MLALAALLVAYPPLDLPCDPDLLVREERLVPGGDEGVSLFLMTVRTPVVPRRGAVVLTHGAGSASSAVWDLRTRGYSVMRALACAGFDAYAADDRGFGGSTMPAAMLGAAADAPPAVRASEAARDLAAVVELAARTSSVAAVDLVAWSWGCDVTGLYAGQNPARVRRIVLYAPVWDRKWPARHKGPTAGAWRVEKRSFVEKLADATREEPEVWKEHLDAAYRFTPDGETLRLPNGPYADIYGGDSPIWDAGRITAPVLIVRGDKDLASLDVHALRLYAALRASPDKRYLVVSGANHFLPRERRHQALTDAILGWLR